MATLITIETLRERIAQGPLTLLDVRTPAEFAEVHIPEARSAPLDSLNPDALERAGQVRRTEPLYLICRTQNRSKLAATAFEKSGYTDVIVVEGGTSGWDSAGYPVVRGTVKVIALERQVRIAAGSLVLLGVLLAWLVNPLFILLSAFVGAGLVFAGITDTCGLGLLLARAPWNRRT
ncbi:rhodanese-like domain-containing protein [Xanthobacter sp. TB0136]|uniref:rhodanese-like domain-containing protein n=1 Tax=Xanthobacter sp. TB0136 TaxID=3459177 RepID=UPI00403A4C06